MEVLYLLIPLSLILVALIVWIFLWAIRSGQYDDLEGPAHRILMDDDDTVATGRSDDAQESNKVKGEK
jgi:cbb3-type cytochrome oxidase maturation protein